MGEERQAPERAEAGWAEQEKLQALPPRSVRELLEQELDWAEQNQAGQKQPEQKQSERERTRPAREPQEPGLERSKQRKPSARSTGNGLRFYPCHKNVPYHIEQDSYTVTSSIMLKLSCYKYLILCFICIVEWCGSG